MNKPPGSSLSGSRGSGDGGTDFVGRLDIGTDHATTSLVVLGQAKCVKPTTAISADQIARVIARLQRGWIGVYVTTGTYSTKAQEEIIDDRYPHRPHRRRCPASGL
jgi:Restriction endonuclease